MLHKINITQFFVITVPPPLHRAGVFFLAISFINVSGVNVVTAY